jgi:twitching motility protein PilT
MLPEGIVKLIRHAKAKKATDIHLCAGAPVLLRVGRDLLPCSEGVLTPEITQRFAEQLLTPEQMELFRAKRDYDFMIAEADGRYRVNVSWNDQCIGLVMRVLPEEAMSLDELHLPEIVRAQARHTKGLVLITGSTSQGKTSTLSGIIREINTKYRRHIVTIEDPIESVHLHRKSIVRQREVGRDTDTFYSGLRAALRQDPDVIAIGEMRDYETIKTALTAAETGVLVLSTLHVISLDKLIERLLSYGPSEDQGHLRLLLAGALRSVIHQELVPTVDGSKRVACEVLIATDAAKNVMRRRDSFHLRNILQTGMAHGMIPMRHSINELLSQGIITEDVANDVLANYT